MAIRVAIVHDYLTQRGGAERVVLQLSDMMPEAPIFTALYDRAGTYPAFGERDVRTSSLQGRVRPEKFRRAALRYPSAFASMDLGGYDVVVVSSSAFAHHIQHPASFVYCHTPPRFLYQPGSYVGSRRTARVLNHKRLLGYAGAPLRSQDRRAAQRHQSYAGNSVHCVSMIRQAYGREARLIHPSISIDHLPTEPPALPSQPRALVVSRLLPYKRIDLAIAACRRLDIPLTIIGEGPDEGRLRAMAGRSAVFKRRVSDLELRQSFVDHSMVLVPGVEDFGLVPVEANYAGRPVVATAAGGALETVQEGTGGVLCRQGDEEGWTESIAQARDAQWSPTVLRGCASPFLPASFRRAVRHWLPDGAVAPDPEDYEASDAGDAGSNGALSLRRT